jgi:signal transduction histidine kinase
VRAEIHALARADQHTRDLRFSLVREIDLLQAYVVEEDATLLRLYRENRGSAQEAIRARQADADRLPEAVRSSLEERVAATARWHAAADAAIARLLLPAGEREPMATILRPLHEEALAATAATRREIGAEIAWREQRIAALHRAGRAFEVFLGALALLSSGLVLWISLRLRELAMEAHRLHAEALAATAARARLLRGVTHDLRNPIGAADLFRQGLLEGTYGELTGPQQQAIARIGSSLGNALELLDDISDLSRAEGRRLEIPCGTVELAPVLRSVWEDAAPAALVARVTLASTPCASAPRVEADARRVRQIVATLVSKAIQNTPPGGSVTLGCKRYGGGARRRGPVAIEVADTGAGIPPDRLEEVFDEYVRLPGSTGGSGLGLALSRQLARSMGGEITVRSEAGRGSTFTLWLHGSANPAPAGEVADHVPT